MTLLVTGATGFLGRAIIRHLTEQGLAVRAAARDPARIEPHPLVTPTLLPDLDSPVDWRALLEDIDGVVHSAGLAHQPAGTDEARLHRVNAGASGGLAKAMADTGLTRLVLISSIRAIAGPSAPMILDETATPAPSDAYGRSKLAAEIAVRSALPSAVILRPPVIYGAGAKANMGRLARLALTPLPLPIGGLMGKRSLVSDRSVSSLVFQTLCRPDMAGATFHVDDGTPLTVGEMVAAMRRALGRRELVFTPPFALDRRLVGLLAPGLFAQLAENLVVSSQALRSTGWRPMETTEAGLARMVQAASGAQTRL